VTHPFLTGAAALLLLGACAHHPGTPSALGLNDEPMARCPMSVPGARLAAADSADGEVLTFTTTEQPAALQDRVQAMADLHNLRHASGAARRAVGGEDVGRGGPPWAGTTMPPSYATVEEVARGAVLTVTPDDPDHLIQLQYALRVHAWRLQHQGCGLATTLKRS
jgi:TusA-related sulfurtransferase